VVSQKEQGQRVIRGLERNGPSSFGKVKRANHVPKKSTKAKLTIPQVTPTRGQEVLKVTPASPAMDKSADIDPIFLQSIGKREKGIDIRR
jgi:hypothetical protein